MNEAICMACKELIDDAKMRCADLVFKEICLEILSRARSALTYEQFDQLTEYAAKKMKEKTLIEATLPF